LKWGPRLPPEGKAGRDGSFPGSYFGRSQWFNGLGGLMIKLELYFAATYRENSGRSPWRDSGSDFVKRPLAND